MHENDISMHENNISMHENVAQEFVMDNWAVHNLMLSLMKTFVKDVHLLARKFHFHA